jgi:hypothetical protein
MADLLIRCSSLGRIMTNPTAAAAKAGEVLSVGAKTCIRELAAQAIYDLDFEAGSKYLEKGRRVESDAIAMVNRLRGLALVKNTERRTDGLITGECDLFDAAHREGRDIKCAWSVATFPLGLTDAEDSGYEWQMRGYMKLWDAERWHVDYCLLDTPDDLIGYELQSMHFVSHIPEHLRITTWTITRDLEKEALMEAKVKAAREYFASVIAEFDRTHRPDSELLPTAPATHRPAETSPLEPAF